MATIRVHTAQNVSLEYEVASLGDRLVATLLDGLILSAWFMACGVLFAALKLKSEAGMVVLGLLVLIPYAFYDLACEVLFNGQSIGKRARDIRVMRLDGTAPSLGDYLLRWLLRIVDISMSSGLVAIITIAANGRGQRLGDLAAGTTVVKVRPQATSPLAPGLSPLAGYQPVFPQAALLADHDVALIRQLAQQASARGNYEVLNELANKVKEITGIRTDLPDGPFLQTVLRDHAHLAATA